jgi:hypothetical protein
MVLFLYRWRSQSVGLVQTGRDEEAVVPAATGVV